MRALGSKAQFIINSGAFTNADITKNSALVNGLYIVNDVPPVNSATESQFPIIKTFVTQMNAEAATGDSDANINDVRSFALAGLGRPAGPVPDHEGHEGPDHGLLVPSRPELGTGREPERDPSQLDPVGAYLDRWPRRDPLLRGQLLALQVEGGQQTLLSSQPINAVSVQG